MNDCDPLRASEQVFVTGCDNDYSRTSITYVIPPPPLSQDWHRADIIAAIRKTGTTLSALSRQNGLSSITLANALARKWPRAEHIIALHLGIPPWEIWPSRYPGKLCQRCTPETGTAVSAEQGRPTDERRSEHLR